MSPEQFVVPIARKYARKYPSVDVRDLINEGAAAVIIARSRGNTTPMQGRAAKVAIRCFCWFQLAPVIHRHRPARVCMTHAVPVEGDEVVDNDAEARVHFAMWRVKVRRELGAVMGEDAHLTEPVLLGEERAESVAERLGVPVGDVHRALRRVKGRIRKSEMLKVALEAL